MLLPKMLYPKALSEIDDRLSAMAVEICARLRNTPVVGGQGKFRDLAKAMFSVKKKKN